MQTDEQWNNTRDHSVQTNFTAKQKRQAWQAAFQPFRVQESPHPKRRYSYPKKIATAIIIARVLFLFLFFSTILISFALRQYIVDAVSMYLEYLSIKQVESTKYAKKKLCSNLLSFLRRSTRSAFRILQAPFSWKAGNTSNGARYGRQWRTVLLLGRLGRGALYRSQNKKCYPMKYPMA